MTRLMGDATHDGVPQLTGVGGLEMVAGYVTGSSFIAWTDTDWATFPGIPHITIDQGFTGSPVADAIVRDVEPGAWAPAAAVNRNGWTPQRPTIYCNRNDLTRAGGVLDSGWQGDLWLAIPGWQEGAPLPATPGCTVVAVQNIFTASYDLSLVLDPAWPNLGDPMGFPQFTAADYRTCTLCSAVYDHNSPADYGKVCAGNNGGPHSSGHSGTADALVMVVGGTVQAGS